MSMNNLTFSEAYETARSLEAAEANPKAINNATFRDSVAGKGATVHFVVK